MNKMKVIPHISHPPTLHVVPPVLHHLPFNLRHRHIFFPYILPPHQVLELSTRHHLIRPIAIVNRIIWIRIPGRASYPADSVREIYPPVTLTQADDG